MSDHKKDEKDKKDKENKKPCDDAQTEGGTGQGDPPVQN